MTTRHVYMYHDTETGNWGVVCPSLDVASVGDDPEDALRMIKEAVELVLEDTPDDEIEPNAELTIATIETSR
jgi:predicted RNase H-like HicB family nuclease